MATPGQVLWQRRHSSMQARISGERFCIWLLRSGLKVVTGERAPVVTLLIPCQKVPAKTGWDRPTCALATSLLLLQRMKCAPSWRFPAVEKLCANSAVLYPGERGAFGLRAPTPPPHT